MVGEFFGLGMIEVLNLFIEQLISNIIIIVQKMNTSASSTSIGQFPHFKNEWKPQGSYYRHILSPDLCELKILSGVTMRHLDLYSSREAYSFPFCPRVYKYVIDGNQLVDNEIGFDIKVLVEYAPLRVGIINEQSTQNIINILKAFQYLLMRFGTFHIKKRMIAKTQLGIVKVWINEDFSSNFIQEQAQSQEQMIKDLYVLVGNKGVFKNIRILEFDSFRSIINHLQQKKGSNNLQKQALKQIQNFQLLLHQRSSQKTINKQQQKAKKNITFSYSNKDIVNQSVTRKEGKRNSIALTNQNNGFQRLSKLISPAKEVKFANNSQQQISSMKFIHQNKYKNRKKISMFNPIHQKSMKQARLKGNNFSHYTSMHSDSSKHEEPSRLKPESLFYSTSCNPYSKFANQSGGYGGKTLSHHRQFEESFKSSSGDCALKNKIILLEQAAKTQLLSQFRIDDDMQKCQELKNDLEALFKSDNEFDYGQLMGELDSIL